MFCLTLTRWNLKVWKLPAGGSTPFVSAGNRGRSRQRMRKFQIAVEPGNVQRGRTTSNLYRTSSDNFTNCVCDTFRTMNELEDISGHIGDRISSLQRMVDLSVVELPRNKMKKLGQELFTLERLLEEFEKCVGRQREQLKHLKEFEASFQKDLKDVNHLKDNIPAHMAKKKGPANGSEPVMKQSEAADVQPAQMENVKKTNKSFIREMDFITMPEFESIPQYMKGRVSYDQLNATVQCINTAVTAKYKILHQSVKTLNNRSRKLHQRFKDQETKDTKGQYFVVEDDIREFTQVCVSKEGTVAEYGMLAKDDIDEGEVLFTIPRSALLHQGTTKISALLEKEGSSLESPSGWVPLLLSLLYEYTSSGSHWKPYLSLWTDFKTLDHPMFWSKEERDRLLRGTGIPEAVDKDLANIQREYKDVVLPFIAKHPDLWNPDTHTLDLYTQLVAFVMAYSFQEPQEEDDDEEDEEDEEQQEAPNPPMMVPMADMLNHVSNHNANLEFTPDSLKMVCVRPIRKGEEVFNTYGQMANWQLLHMYGFVEPYQSNSNDTADIPIGNLYEIATQGSQSDLDRQLLEEQWEMACEILQEKAAFVFGKQGCLTDTELHTVLKVISMSGKEFSEFKDNEGWEEDEEDDEKISLAFSNEGLPGLKASWKGLIRETARLTVRSYRDGGEGEKMEDVDVDRALIEDEAALAALSSRQQRALQVRFGQKSILYRLMELTTS
ncbi:N-lysine methyltransferase setd6 [Larimichthys crocea]|uniref:Uncharacterized protein n=1 Tax=Larimichthys crocea TaxID=215358 RepID=A0ACD3QG25_LARCR|nr:N-lysine methyltransferase setd6 [Larimichthys crocea]